MIIPQLPECYPENTGGLTDAAQCKYRQDAFFSFLNKQIGSVSGQAFKAFGLEEIRFQSLSPLHTRHGVKQED